jgi:hypothetical protein
VGQKATGLKDGEPGYPQGDTAFLFSRHLQDFVIYLRGVVSSKLGEAVMTLNRFLLPFTTWSQSILRLSGTGTAG